MSADTAGCWWSPFRTVGNATVIHVDLNRHAARESQGVAWLDDEEVSRSRLFRHAGARRQFVLCRAALRAILCGKLGCKNDRLSFGLTGHGKPFAVVRGSKAPVSFSVSHSGKHGLIAIAPGGRLGVDVEEPVARRDLDGLIATLFGPDERAELDALSGESKLRLFLDYWTIKEALIKALGTGHRVDVSKFQVPAKMRDRDPIGIFRFSHLPDVPWRVENLGNEDFAAALAVEVKPV